MPIPLAFPAPPGVAFSLAQSSSVGLGGGASFAPVAVKIRKEFPETWVWDTIDENRFVIYLSVGTVECLGVVADAYMSPSTHPSD